MGSRILASYFFLKRIRGPNDGFQFELVINFACGFAGLGLVRIAANSNAMPSPAMGIALGLHLRGVSLLSKTLRQPLGVLRLEECADLDRIGWTSPFCLAA
jgi:hypothetical protein